MFPVILTLSFCISVAASTFYPNSRYAHQNASHNASVHSYGAFHVFHRRDGWETIPVSDLSYKYDGEDSPTPGWHAHTLYGRPQRRSRVPKKNQKNPINPDNIVAGGVEHVVDATIKGIGKAEEVTITWYTGKDLKNPSCWSKEVWTPTDASFACALTLEGWLNRPKCFQFLELCNGPSKCIFVRVVDTCAGCEKGSKHVDLTKAAFEALATLDKGILQVNMRLATDPKEWNYDLWGPQTV